MNSQQALNKTAAMIRTQGEPGMKNNICVYRTDKGYGCPIGVWLNDEMINEMKAHGLIDLNYPDIFDYTAISPDSHPFTKTARGILEILDLSDKTEGEQCCFWSSIQNAHDRAAMQRQAGKLQFYHGQEFIDRFNANLRKFATDFGLEYPVEGYEVQEIIPEQITLEGDNDE